MQSGSNVPAAPSGAAADITSDVEGEQITSSKASFEDAPQEQVPSTSHSGKSHPSEDRAPSEDAGVDNGSKPGSQKAPSRKPSREGEGSRAAVVAGSQPGSRAPSNKAPSQAGSRGGSQQGSRRGSQEAAVTGESAPGGPVADAPTAASDAAIARERGPGDENREAFRDSTITAVSESTAQMLGRDGVPKTTTDPSTPGVLAGIGEDGPDDDELEPLTKYVDWTEHISISIGPFVILFFDLALPVCIYYSWLRARRNDRRAACQGAYDAGVECGLPPVQTIESRILGFAIIAFGFGEVYILVVRVYRLIARWEECAPLLSKHWWELDATTWVYTLGLIAALVPFVCSTTVYEPFVVEWLYLYAPAFMFMVLDVIAFLTLIPIKIPFRINSDPKGSRLKPIVYYAAEDFFAVDGAQNREFRKKYVERYEKSMMFRKMILELTLFWIGGCTCYIGYVAAMIWNLEFERAFGSTLGVLFGWIIIWGVSARFWIEYAIKREQKWWKESKAEREAAKLQ
ncbi:zinc metalloproteinase nas-7 [Colletotrichum spaethianum]|uniref:Zinc metalloproteinase nas-7 n=1 Tax=Colletotrichum spaethianum TaxID=700344 RepID=A0AA37LA76_9PEZI|nr:zinc metalloproteinase nas-7 [Colletotrichum spaethianum]GKT43554.1 zinc metalloproteinase nas-7 [Colletotrichum spaethianum]